MTNHNIFELYCDKCHWKRVADTLDKLKDLYEIKTSPIPSGSPKFNIAKKQVIDSKPLVQKKKFRCPSCGNSVVGRFIPDVQKNFESKVEHEKRIEERNKLEISIMDHSRRKIDENRIDGSETSSEGPPIS